MSDDDNSAVSGLGYISSSSSNATMSDELSSPGVIQNNKNSPAETIDISLQNGDLINEADDRTLQTLNTTNGSLNDNVGNDKPINQQSVFHSAILSTETAQDTSFQNPKRRKIQSHHIHGRGAGKNQGLLPCGEPAFQDLHPSWQIKRRIGNRQRKSIRKDIAALKAQK